MNALSVALRQEILRPPFNPLHLKPVLYLSGDDSPRTMAAGMAADFEAGTSKYLSRADNASISTGDIDFTWAGWVQFESAPGAADSRTVLGKWAANQQEYILNWEQSDDRFHFYVSNDGSAAVTVAADTFGAPTTATWYFIACWHDSVNNVIGISVNGGAADTAAHTTGVRDGTAALEFGRNGVSTASFHDGLEQCWGFWKSALSTDQITTVYNGGVPLAYHQLPSDLKSEASLVSYWELNEPSGTRNDLHGTNHLIDNNTVTTAAGTCLNAVEQWNDLSGNGRHASQSTQANKPVLRYANGHYGVLGDGVNDYLDATISGFQNLTGVTVIAVLIPKTTAAANVNHGTLWGYGNLDAAGGSFPEDKGMIVGGGSSVIAGESWTLAHDNAAHTTGRLGPSAANFPFTANAPFIETQRLGTSGAVLRANGANATLDLESGITAASDVSPSATGFTVDDIVHLFAGRLAAVIAGFGNLTIREFILYNRELTTAEIVRVERYLSRQYGIAVTA